MNDMAGLLNDSLQLAVDGVDPLGDFAYFANPEAAFAGHGACSSSGEYIRHIVHTRTPGEKPSLYDPSQQSFHPNVDGTAAYAGVATAGYLVLM